MGKPTGNELHCPACAVPIEHAEKGRDGTLRCRCGRAFARGGVTAEAVELEELEGPTNGALLEPSEEYNLAGDEPPSPRAKPTTPVRPAATRSFAADVAAQYPDRRANPVSVEAEEEALSALKNLYFPLALLAAGFGLRVGQLLFAHGVRGNQWWGSANATPGVGKSLLLALFEMIIACAITAVGAFIAGVMLSIDFGSLGKATLKLSAAAVFATGVACWIALFDQGAYSVAGLVFALHAIIVIYWIILGYLFSLELQELLLTVAVITLAHSLGIAGLWRG